MYEHNPVTPRMQHMRDLIRDRVIWIDAEQANIITETDRQCGAMLPYLKHAKYLKAICEQKTVRVEDFEVIVGNRGTRFCGSGVNPQWEGGGMWLFSIEAGSWTIREDGCYHNPDDFGCHLAMTVQDYEGLCKVREYWTGKTMNDIANASELPASFREVQRTGGPPSAPEVPVMLGVAGHLTAGFQHLVNKGYGAIRKQAQDWVDAHYDSLMGEDTDKYMFYKSVIDVCDGMTTLCHRYAEACEDKAMQTDDPVRKAELLDMADGLHWIATNPCRHYREALQAAILYMHALFMEYMIDAGSFGRVDQWAWPFLKKDLEDGTLTLEQAQEITDCFYLKINTFYGGGEGPMAEIAGIGNTYLHNTLGGVDPITGEDATNEITYMALASLARLKLHDPTISLRINKNTPDELWDTAFEVNRIVGGLPLFQNDEEIIPGIMQELGFSLEDARNYAIIGCQEITGSGNDYPACNGIIPPNINLHYSTTLNMAINNGINPFNGEQGTVQPGYLYEMKSIDEVKQAWYDVSFHIHSTLVSVNNYCETIVQQYAPHIALSLFTEGCMEKGMDVTWGGAKYNSYGGTGTGLATVADSLSAIKYMCFDNDFCTLREMYDAVMDNWKGHEELQHRIIRDAPHFGNGDAEADAMMDWVTNAYYEMCTKFHSKRAKVFKAGLYGASDHVAQGYTTWATPDGRANPSPIADGASPVQGRDKNGPTSVLMSALSYRHNKFMDGMALNIRIHPSVVSREDGKAKLRDLTKTYLDNGGMEVQYNVVSTEDMRAAQADPDAYKDLVVRIAGYSAYFVELNRDQQNDLISRTENTL